MLITLFEALANVRFCHSPTYLAATGITNKSSTANEAALTELGQNASELSLALEKEKEASDLFLESKDRKLPYTPCSREAGSRCCAA